MAQAASNAGEDPGGLSFKHTVQLWTEWIAEVCQPQRTADYKRGHGVAA